MRKVVATQYVPLRRRGVNSQFVAGAEAVLKVCPFPILSTYIPNLSFTGNSQLHCSVRWNIWIGHSPRPSFAIRSAQLCGPDGLSRDRHDEELCEDEARERRQECKELEALDLTGRVSAVFVSALAKFISNDHHHPWRLKC